MNKQVSNEEIAAYAEGIADRATSRRVLRAALMDASVSERLSALEAHDRKYNETHAAMPSPMAPDALADERTRRLWASMRNATLTIAAEAAPLAAKTGASGSAARERGHGPVMECVLQIGRQLLTLPCLAPITASAASEPNIHRQAFQTGDGVRIEFQQLPGASPFRLRVIVDASQIQTGSNSAATYSVAYLTLEDSGSVEGSLPDRHVLIVTLNDKSRGFADFVIGANTGEPRLPAQAGACRLVSATLAHLRPEEQQNT